MELVRGRDLLQIINRCRANRRRIPMHIALYVLSRVCKGLDYAHRVKSEGHPVGIIHRDVSPSNILASWEGEVKVADFGIAKAAHKDEKTATDTLKGKYGYMSPEQVKGLPTDHRSDIFAAGILLWETLTGRRLFKGVTDLETLEKVRAAEVPTLPSQINKRIPQEVDRVVLKALSPDPAYRYQTAGEFQDALTDQLFKSGKRVDSRTLAAFMHQLFSREIEEEEIKERERSQPGFPPPPVAPVAHDDLRPLTPTPTPVSYVKSRGELASMPPSHVSKAPMSSFVIGALATGLILLAAAMVLGIYWLANRPGEPVPGPQAGDLQPALPPPIIEEKRAGTLSITSQPPGAAIVLNGKSTGLYTPYSVRDLDRSKIHRVALTHRDYKRWSKTVEFGEMEMVSLDAQLTRKPEKRPPPPPRREHGTLNINAVPVWAYVYINGQKQSKPTPIYDLKLKPGTYTIRLVNPKLRLRKTQRVTIRKGKKTDLVVKMR
jgi:hypothetical protein